MAAKHLAWFVALCVLGTLLSFLGSQRSQRLQAPSAPRDASRGASVLAPVVTGRAQAHAIDPRRCAKKPAQRGDSIVVLGAMFDAPTFDYSFYMPVVAAVWASRGVRTLALLTGDGWDTEMGKLVVAELRRINGTIVYFMAGRTFGANVALTQVARHKPADSSTAQHAAALLLLRNHDVVGM